MKESKKTKFIQAYERICRGHKMFIQKHPEFGYMVLTLGKDNRPAFDFQREQMQEN